MIVKVTLPKGKTGASYGGANFMAHTDGTLDLPAYVAKSFSSIEGVTVSTELPDPIEKLVSNAEVHELRYLFLAMGVPVPDKDANAAAAALISARGVPAVFLT